MCHRRSEREYSGRERIGVSYSCLFIGYGGAGLATYFKVILVMILLLIGWEGKWVTCF